MQGRFLIALLLSMSLSRCLARSNEKPTDPIEFAYTTGDILNVRSNANIEAQRIFQLPYGTKVQVLGKDIPLGKPGFWIFLPELNGYVSAEFLQSDPPPGTKQMNLMRQNYAFICGSDFFENKETLVLGNGQVKYTRTELGGESGKLSGQGTYAIQQDQLRIEIGRVTGWNCDPYNSGPASCPNKRNVSRDGFVLSLAWVERAGGFLTAEEKELLVTSDTMLSQPDCLLVPRKIGKERDVSKWCDRNPAASGGYKFTGYFCVR